MSSCKHEVERISGDAWSGLTRDLRQVGKRTQSCATAFVRQHPTLTVVASVGLGVVLVSRLIPNSSTRPAAPKKPQPPKRRGAWLAVSGMLGNALLDWAMRSMSSPRHTVGGSPPSPDRN